MLVEKKTYVPDVKSPLVTKTSYIIHAYGLLDDGKAQVFELDTLAEIKWCSDIENNPEFALGATPIRFWVFFLGSDKIDDNGVVVKTKGAIDRIDFHKQPSPNFESKIFDPKQEAAKAEIADLKLEIENKAK